MRSSLPLLLLFAPLAAAQAADDKTATLKYIAALRDPDTGAYAVSPPKDGEKPKPSLRAVNGAVKAIHYLGGEVTGKDKLTRFVMGCYDEKTGAFAEPGGKPDVAITSIGVMAAAELGVPKEKYQKAMEYLKQNAKSFEEVRIAAAAVEAVGVKESGIDVKPWVKAGVDALRERVANAKDGGARQIGSAAALVLRLEPDPEARAAKQMRGELRPIVHPITDVGQLDDGGWGKKGEKASDAESTYRVMRCLMLLKQKPKDVAGVKKFLASCRRKDGGYGVDAAAPSSMSGTYYYAAITKWLTEMDGK